MKILSTIVFSLVVTALPAVAQTSNNPGVSSPSAQNSGAGIRISRKQEWSSRERYCWFQFVNKPGKHGSAAGFLEDTRHAGKQEWSTCEAAVTLANARRELRPGARIKLVNSAAKQHRTRRGILSGSLTYRSIAN